MYITTHFYIFYVLKYINYKNKTSLFI